MAGSNQLVPQGPLSNTKLFNEAHNFLHNIAGELEVFKQQVLEDNEHRKAELAEARQKLENETFERREQMNKLRYEFEDFVNRKVDRVLEEIEEMKMSEKRDDSSQQKQIECIVRDLELLREDLFAIQAAWNKLVSNCIVVPAAES
eukprot:TRINITY_DN63687_c0_g1_i1.p3 TRINITY_DN63687_c0_g1~~TRINITY_DN63687_c0_g1_i1.p3  ORF type:complete len:146 (-),score=44.70 TRINITY_DN63687_c0_g1_i1:111-548(-)